MSKITSKNIESNITFTTNPRYESDPTVDNDLARKKYVNDQDALKISKSGDTMGGDLAMGSNKITGLANGANPGDAINKGQFDAGLEGLKPKASAQLASTGSNLVLSGEQTIDGVLTSVSRILVKDQTDASENGIYITGAGAWTRAVDMDASTEVKGCYVPVSEGTLNTGRNFVQTGAFAVLDTDDINFVFFNSAASAHTHVASEVTDFDTEVANNPDVAANTAKVSADGSVTSHSDVTNAGSGIIISAAERTKLEGIETGAEVNDTPGREVITLVAQDITNGYVELAQPALSNSLSVTPIGGIPQEPGVDFTESIVVTNTRVTFAGDLLDLIAGEKLLMEYVY